MIKLTQILFDIKETTQTKIENMESFINEEFSKADNLGLPRPEIPTKYKLQEEDYESGGVPVYLDSNIIQSISQNILGDTLIETSTDRTYTVKESPRQVFNLIYKN